MASFCRKCGAVLDADDLFCGSCGNLVGSKAESASVPLSQAIEISAFREEDKLGVQSEGDDLAPAPPRGNLVSSLLQSGPFYFLTYFVLAIPTYILPYFGSNSTFLNSISAIGGAGAFPLFYFHLTFLYLLCILAWLRGSLIDRSWLPVFPIFAALFDLAPGFNWIFLAPTIFHILAMILGVSKAVAPEAVSAGISGKLKFGLLGLVFLVMVSFYKMANYDTATRGALDQITGSGPEFSNRSGSSNARDSATRNLSIPPSSASMSDDGATAHAISLGDLNAYDTWTRSSFPCASGGAAGGLADDTLQVGGWGDTYITLLRFDMPDTRTVRSARLVFQVKGKDEQYRPTPVRLRVINQEWMKSGECFLWSNVPSSTLVSSTTSPGLPGNSYAIDITQIYNSWATGSQINRGVIIEPTLTDNNWSNFYSTRAGEALSPKLVLTY